MRHRLFATVVIVFGVCSGTSAVALAQWTNYLPWTCRLPQRD